MDRNTVTGLLLIGIILVGFNFFFLVPNEQEMKEARRVEDSIKASKVNPLPSDSLTTEEVFTTDSIVNAPSIVDTNTFYTIENERIKVNLSAKGGRVYSVEIKDQLTWDGRPLILYDGEKSNIGFNFFVGNTSISTNELYFTTQNSSTSISGKDSTQFTFRYNFAEEKYIEFIYKLNANDYELKYDVLLVGMNALIPRNNNYLNLVWEAELNQLEKDIRNERSYTTAYYQYSNAEVDYLSEAKDVSEKLITPVKWISFKQHFFSSILIADNQFSNGEISTVTDLNKSTLKKLSADMAFEYKGNDREQIGMKFYFGPNHYNTLKSFGLGFEQQVKLGWGPLNWINRYAVIPIFNFLNRFGLGFGIIILILTIILKVAMLPLTYRSYISQAKMRALKPEMDEIKAKVGDDDPTKLQQEYLKLYKAAGVNPLGGCLPLLLQMPFLIAFFYFFPASFELRQEGFLWVKDLSTYDSIWDFGYVPIINFIYGDHVSLMCILMTISTLIYTWMNNKISGVTGQMKYLGYIMPIMFLGFLNSFAAGLNYYYLCANLITFAQQAIIRRFVNDDAIHKQIEANKKRPNANKKSSFQIRLEEMAKKRGIKMPPPPDKKKK